MVTLKQGIRISAIIDKLELDIKDPTASQEKVGADLIMQVLSKAHKAEQEIYSLVSDIKKISKEEAAEIDLVEFIKDIMKDSDLTSFFKSAAKSKLQE